MELVELCEALPAEKRAEVTDFARFLLGRSQDAYGLEAAELRSVSRRLHDKVADALEARLAAKNASGAAEAWKEFYGSMRHLHDERPKIESLIEDEFEQVDASQWR